MQVQINKYIHHSFLEVILITASFRNLSIFHWCKYNQALRTGKEKENRDTLEKGNENRKWCWMKAALLRKFE